MKSIDSFDWATWVPHEKATLVFVRCEKDGEKGFYLIEKKRGLGAGKINAPGGRFELGETAEECAIRECQEEIGLTPSGLILVAELSFVFADGYSLFGYAFIASSYSGTLIETDEAKPFFCPEDKIPYEKMWADDILWLPLALEGKLVQGRFLFDGDTMLAHDVKVQKKVRN